MIDELAIAALGHRRGAARGTEGSNLLSSTGESTTNRGLFRVTAHIDERQRRNRRLVRQREGKGTDGSISFLQHGVSYELFGGCGPGEWLAEKHAARPPRSWRKLHIGVDADTGQIIAAELTSKDVDDGSQVGPLLEQIAARLR